MPPGELHQLFVRNLACRGDDKVGRPILLLAPRVQVRGRHPADAQVIAKDRAPQWLVAEGRSPQLLEDQVGRSIADFGELLEHHLFLAPEVAPR